MVGGSPRGHRHDGCSPLPLGMDVSPAPTCWTGANTIWPHDPSSGWSYCVMINSWVTLPDSNAASSDVTNSSTKPTVFFRVLVGLQSPNGVSTLHGILRRFSDFLKLNDSLKRMFPRKKLPPPPKKSLRQISHNKHHLQQRRLALSEWILKLLGDLDVSRSAPMASFLDLEEATKAAQPDMDTRELHSWLDEGAHRRPELRILPVENDLSSEADDSIAPADSISLHEESMEEIVTSNTLVREKPSSWHARRHSIDSDTSEVSFASGSELSIATMGGDGRDQGLPSFDVEIIKAIQALLPIDQRGTVRRVLATLQRRVTRARVDMEDLAARLNQEMATKDFFSTKVKDLEVELEMVKRKSLESLEQAVSIEREGFMNLQWELEECRVALTRAMEDARSAQESRNRTEEQLRLVELENRRLKHALSESKGIVESLQADRDSIRAKAAAEMKVLVKEVKALRKSQPELKQSLEAALRANKELEAQVERQKKQKASRLKTLFEVEALRERLQQCTVDALAKEDAQESDNNAAVMDAADLLSTSDSRIGLLIAEAQLLGEEEGNNDDDMEDAITEGLRAKEIDKKGAGQDEGSTHVKESGEGGDNSGVTLASVKPLRKLLLAIFIDNAHLYQLVNSLTLKALLVDSKQTQKEKAKGNEAVPRKSMLHRFL